MQAGFNLNNIVICRQPHAHVLSTPATKHGRGEHAAAERRATTAGSLYPRLAATGYNQYFITPTF